MTFIICAEKNGDITKDHYSNALIAVIVARRLEADGYVVSVTGPYGETFKHNELNNALRIP